MDRPNSPPRLLSRPFLILAAGGLISIVVFGPRSSFGLFVEPISASNGWGRDVFALAMALQQLLWGALQPAGGAMADRYGAWWSISIGGALYGAGMILMTYTASPTAFYLTAGVLIGAGLAGAGLPVVVAAVGRLVPPEHRTFAFGVVTAAGSLGQFLFAPLGQTFIHHFGWVMALWLMGLPLLALPLIALPLRAKPSPVINTGANMQVLQAIAHAFRHRSYVLLMSGFFVCGFHVSFITVHLPPYFHDIGIAPLWAAWSLSLIGLFNVIGSLAAGSLGQRFSKRYLLTTLYSLRGLAIAAFLLSAKSTTAVLLFSAAMGLLWLSTVPLTSGLVVSMFGTRFLGTLFGFVFFSHQVGAFLGIWLGGYLFESEGSYQSTWIIAIFLAFAAALIHLPIKERAAPGFLEPQSA